MLHLKKLFLLASILFFLFIPFLTSAEKAETDNLAIQILSTPTCPHCNAAKIFLADLKNSQMPNLMIYDYNISNNIDKAKELYQEYGVPQQYQGLVPVIFIADRYFVGFSEQTGEEIASFINSQARIQDYYEKEVNQTNMMNSATKLPLIGEINLMNYSLPTLAIVLGIVDGFNVCSLGALVLILGLVITLRSRRRILFLGATFLLTTGLVYGLMIFLWHRLFLLLAPYMRSLELIIGLLSVIGGLYLLREFYQAWKRGPICSSNNILSRLSPKVEKIFQNKTNWLVLLGAVIIFSGVVTIIEFPCSAVIPVLFTGVLAQSGINQSLALLYIGIFLLFYLLDELIIFLIAVFTMKIKIVSPRFIIFFNLLASIIFISLGIFYLAGWTL